MMSHHTKRDRSKLHELKQQNEQLFRFDMVGLPNLLNKVHIQNVFDWVYHFFIQTVYLTDCKGLLAMLLFT